MKLPSYTDMRDAIMSSINLQDENRVRGCDFVTLLEHCLISRAALTAYIRVLEDIAGKHILTNAPDAEQLETIVEHGLAGLSGNELSQFARNPVALSTARLCIVDRFPDYWSTLMANAVTHSEEFEQPPMTNHLARTQAPSPRPMQPTYGLSLAAQPATAEKSSKDGVTATLRLSRYKLVDEGGAQFALETDREGCVFVVLPAAMLNSAPRSVLIRGDSYALRWARDHSFEIEDLGKGDLRDFADTEFCVKGVWQS